MQLDYPKRRPGTVDGIPARRRIVVGVDGSAGLVAALAWAATEARLRQAELVAIYAWERTERCRAPYAPRPGLPSRQEPLAAATSRLSDAVRAAFGQAPPPWLRAEVAEGRPERALPGRAAGAEMLVLGCDRRAGDFPAAPGPVHRACLHSALCPVAIVGCLPGPVPGRRDPRQPTVERADAGGSPLLPEMAAASRQRRRRRRLADRPRVPSARPGHEESCLRGT